MQRIGAALWPALEAYQVYGANTNVGKTIASVTLCNKYSKNQKFKTHYIKPVSTGPADEADGRHLSTFAPNVSTRTLFQFKKAVSPHIAAREENAIPSDSIILQKTSEALEKIAKNGPALALVETAGGVHSPSPSGSSQADLYRVLRLPVILVGDYHLGGISATVSAYESLRIRGYDVWLHVIFNDEDYENSSYLTGYFQARAVPTLALPKPPIVLNDKNADIMSMQTYYQEAASSDRVSQALGDLRTRHDARIAELDSMPDRAHQTIWHPFTQHQGRAAKDIMVIDSAYQDNFDILRPDGGRTPGVRVLQTAFDGSASWWTQGLGHGNPELALAAAYAAGRYGHVMFAGAIHEPGLSLAGMLLKHHENPRLAKVFFTDNGSTGMEVALKMALCATRKKYSWATSEPIEIIGLKDSYHDWFNYPRVRMIKGSWVIEMPPELGAATHNQSFSTLDEIFDLQSRQGHVYQTYIVDTLRALQQAGRKSGALVLEPVLLGAGGMSLVDPLFQHTLIKVIRENPGLISGAGMEAPTSDSSSSFHRDWVGLPVVFDEVFTGVYRLGRFNCNSFLQSTPDIVVNAKLLTGGIVPLCTTTASQAVYDAFLSDSKTDALLHGHSYTAHAIGCQVAVETLTRLQNGSDKQPWWQATKNKDPQCAMHRPESPRAWSMWGRDFVADLSLCNDVEGVVAIGTVLAITLTDQGGGGYMSTAAQGLHSRLLEFGEKGWAVHSRVLGNVLYLMTSLTISPETVLALEELLLDSLR